MTEARQVFRAGEPRRVPGGLSIVGYRSDGLDEGTHLGVPSATLTFILSLDGPVVGAPTAADLAQGRTRSAEVLLSGLDTAATHVRQPSHQEGVQLALDPLACRALFGVPAGALGRGMADPDQLGARGRMLWQRVGEAQGSDERFGLVADQLSAWATASDGGAPRPELVGAWRLLRRHHGALRMDELAAAVALSPRQLRSLFRAEFGIGPKTAARLMRFDRALAAITRAVRSGRGPDLAGIAAACGYADQAHLARESRGFMGCSATEWIAEERRNIQAGGHDHGADSTP